MHTPADISLDSKATIRLESGKWRSGSLLKTPLFYHISFWLLYFLLNTMRWGSYFDDYVYSLKSNLVEFPIHIMLVYFNLYFLLPRFLRTNLSMYVLILFTAVLALSLLRIVLTYEFVTTDIWRESTVKQESLFNLNYVLAVFIGEIYVVGLTTAIKLGFDWVETQKLNRELERRNHETELSFLRSQVQPHFFFNTLNNLYSLTLDKSDRAPDTVLKLSELMSHVIYNGNKPRIELLVEVKHIQNYIDLETLRYGDKLDVAFEVEGVLEDKYVPPLILIPFIENSFKHGIQVRNGCIPLRIRLAVKDEHLFFTIWNLRNREPHAGGKAGIFHKGSGIGIQNTRRRLELIYDHNFDLEIQESAESFTVSLKVKLDEV
ncbi:putative two-component system sensor protein, without kinase domain [Flammeovirgaceae bacterium 311]|nr:putative two-component system sensor protein, without kinase domain [Flammeovirgaceae bacterium 311]